MEQIFSSEWFIASASLAGGFIVRMIFDRRKVNAENQSAQLDADSKAVELYERYVSRLQPEIDSLKTKQDQLTEAISALRIENANLKIENAELKAENGKLHLEVQGFNQQIEALKKQIAKKTRP
jgi:peptidoglycan hydrolase CwlO-like protein